jgi:hypothetical protein
MGDGGRVPVPESDVAALEVDVERTGIWTILDARGTVTIMVGWRCLFDAIVGEVPIVSC